MSSRSNDDDRHNFVVGVDLDDVERIVLNRLGVAACAANTCEDETLAADRHDAQRRYREADVGGRLHMFDHGISTMWILGIHDPSMIVAGMSVGHSFSHGVPVAGR